MVAVKRAGPNMPNDVVVLCWDLGGGRTRCVPEANKRTILHCTASNGENATH